MNNAMFAAAAAVLVVGACQPDPRLKATRTACEQACSHASGLNRGPADDLTTECANQCIEQEWTNGDAKCVADAKTYEEVKDCAAVAKALLAGVKRREAAAAVSAAAAALDARRKLEAKMAEHRKAVDALIAQLAAAPDAETRQKLEKQLEEARTKTLEIADEAKALPRP